MRGVDLETINRLLGVVGLVMVVMLDPKDLHRGPFRFWIETRRSYDARCRA